MQMLQSNNSNILKVLAVSTIILFTSTNSLAELNQVEKVYAQKGYPYGGLVDRSEEVTIIYSQKGENINCRVEVLQNGQIWQGKRFTISIEKFTQKPLRACMDRVDAKKLFANTF